MAQPAAASAEVHPPPMHLLVAQISTSMERIFRKCLMRSDPAAHPQSICGVWCDHVPLQDLCDVHAIFVQRAMIVLVVALSPAGCHASQVPGVTCNSAAAGSCQSGRCCCTAAGAAAAGGVQQPAGCGRCHAAGKLSLPFGPKLAAAIRAKAGRNYVC